MAGCITIDYRNGQLTKVNVHNIASVRVGDCRHGSYPSLNISLTAPPTTVILYMDPYQALQLAKKLADLFWPGNLLACEKCNGELQLQDDGVHRDCLTCGASYRLLGDDIEEKGEAAKTVD